MTTKLEELCLLIVDCEHKTAPTQADGYPSIRTPNIGRGRFILDGVNRVSEETYNAWTRRAVPQEGDLIMAREAPVGNVACVPAGLSPCLGQRTLLIRPDPTRVDSRFLTYFLLGPEIQHAIHGQTNGATVPHLNMADVRRFPIPRLPPLEEQKRIAAVLGAYDDLIENCERRIKVLDEMARSLYREWFIEFRFPGGNGRRPANWREALFTEVADVLSGGTPKTGNPEFWNGEIPFFTPRDAPDGIYVFDTEKHVTSSGVNACASELFPLETVFITARGTVGKLALPAIPMAMNQSCYALRAKPPLTTKTLYLLALTQVEHLRRTATGATFDAIVVATFERMKITVPDAKTLHLFEKHVGPIFDAVKVLGARQRNLRATRDLLLPRLISGQLAPPRLVADERKQ